ncbi:bifunctional glutamate--cysteine ligase GshA/glutathione synthetase GshB [uncultured Clostridium sp.]|uniref:bifunctional glutamate--cysteine ligase GshA/glutathione synthetase GshB n=1 Tax=uncultured Clostridium sp. TaxID=59620 RepID=UPI002611E924|nr:bifunctional glutamate--cysteine ligase GshA/glutathione synthetase GshB [uncultured Clostridium sp.]
MDNLLNKIIDEGLKKGLIECNYGLEKENIRVNKYGEISLDRHPKVFKEDNLFIKRDFAESQMEMVTPVCNSIDSAYSFMENLNNIVNIELKDEYLWPQSNPPKLPSEEKIKVAELNDKKAKEYRENLVKKYGKKRQLVSGVHYNFSFRDEFIENLYKMQNTDISLREFKNELYFKIGRNFLKYKWFLTYLTGASPVFHKSYVEKCTAKGEALNTEDYYFKGVGSLRNSRCGYRNEEDFYVSYNNLEEYIRDIRRLIDDKCIQQAKEYYSAIRFKSKEEGDMLTNLEENGVRYIEIRLLDLDPTTKFGISKNSLYLIHLYVLFCLFKEDEKYTLDVHNECVQNDNRAIKNSEENTLIINKREVTVKKAGLKILEEIEKIKEEVFKDTIYYKDFNKIIENSKLRFEDNSLTIASRLIEGIKESNYLDYFMAIAIENKRDSKENAFKLLGYEDLELSTQILLIEALKYGVDFKVLDREENFIELNFRGKKEYVKQATKTSKDNYITALIMENKLVSKKVLAENNIRVPQGGYYISTEDAIEDFQIYKDKKLVIKPKTTNFGIGITIFKNPPTLLEYREAVDIAFNEDKSILIEEFIQGKEYRFLIINDEVVGILHRVPANVTGDGINNIRLLIEKKNKDPLRGRGYKTPLEKIRVSKAEEMFLKNNGLDFSYIPKKDEVIYLRENSNISTGGDSIDFTDDIHISYKEIALKSAKAVNAKIIGVDMMIEDIKGKANDKNYGIIEINFNPAIHIHCFPYKGENRKAGEKLIKLLFEDIE